MSELTTLLIKLPRNTEVTPEAAPTFLSALTQINYMSGMQKLMGGKPPAFALEIALVSQQIYFLITCDTTLVSFIETQVQSNYPLAIIEEIKYPLDGIQFGVVSLKLRRGSFYPLANYKSFQDIDPLSSILSVLSKTNAAEEVILIQLALESNDGRWQGQGSLYAEKGAKNTDGTYSERSDKSVINEKTSYPGFYTSFRVVSTTKKTLTELASAYGVYSRSDGNSLGIKRPPLFTKNAE